MAEPSNTKPTYNMAQNTGYMIGQAWHCHKSVLGVCLALAVLHVAVSLTELYLAPLVLGKVESAAPLGELFSTIGVMAEHWRFSGVCRPMWAKTRCTVESKCV